MSANAFQRSYERAGEEAPIWPAPDMSILNGGRSAPVSMPQGVFGSVWPLIEDLAEGAGAPVEYVAVGIFGVAASLIGGKRRIQPFDSPQWQEPCILWIAAVGDPSSGKSPAIDAATGPLRGMEVDHAERHRSTLQDYATSQERAKAERKAWEERVKVATKDGGETPRMPDQAVEPEEPMRRRLMVMDATPEAVGAILAGNPAGTLHLRDELAGWLMSFDRYSPGGREFWLEAYGGRAHIIDRKNTAKPIQIPFNGVSVLGGIQPEKMADCLLGTADDGLVARFLWAWPDAIPFRRPRQVADARRLEHVYRRLDGLVPSYGLDGEERPVVVQLSASAADLFEAWVAETNAAVSEAASLYKGFCGKLKGMVLRLALIAELVAWADSATNREPAEVSAETLVAVLEFVEEYAKPTALRVFGDAALPAVERNAATLARHIIKQGATVAVINARDIRRAAGTAPALKNADDLEEAISHLAEADWLRAAPLRAGDTPGRAKKDWQVNPLVHGGADA